MALARSYTGEVEGQERSPGQLHPPSGDCFSSPKALPATLSDAVHCD